MRILNSYSLSEALLEIIRHWNDTGWWIKTFNSHIAGRVQRALGDEEGTHVLEEDWDNLVILDACRFDLFEAAHRKGLTPPGTLESRISQGSGSPEFIRRNFGTVETINEVVYVTANPFIEKLLDDPFYHVDHVWIDGWDDDDGTVRAETMVERTIGIVERFPDKRIISHWMQPHHPFVGRTRLESDRGFVAGKGDVDEGEQGGVIWNCLRNGELDRETVWVAYRDNLVYALEHVGRLVEEIRGKTVLTSDHGNAFGERNRPFPTRVYGHPDRVRIPELVKVPWFIVDHDERRKIAASTGVDPESEREETGIEDRLEALGYR